MQVADILIKTMSLSTSVVLIVFAIFFSYVLNYTCTGFKFAREVPSKKNYVYSKSRYPNAQNLVSFSSVKRLVWIPTISTVFSEDFFLKCISCNLFELFEGHCAGNSNKDTLFDESFSVPYRYNFSVSTTTNYRSDSPVLVGKYKKQRSLLDYNYHTYYSAERQLLHDQLIDQFLRTRVYDRKQNVYCETPLENWIVFTAGVMGAGKGHTIQWLNDQGLFPMEAFVNVDPDALRMLLPETAEYNKRDDQTTGFLTQKEVGYISEVRFYAKYVLCC
jgi:hypothetical protein